MDALSTEGIIAVYLKEDFTNEWESAEPQTPEAPIGDLKIIGPAQVYPYDIVWYEAPLGASGAWLLSNTKATIVEQNVDKVKIEITSGKSGSVDLIYRVDDCDDVVFHIEILSL